MSHWQGNVISFFTVGARDVDVFATLQVVKGPLDTAQLPPPLLGELC